jgi:hypothetical protein
MLSQLLPSARLVDLGDAELAVREWGDTDLPVILFWHALGPAGSGAHRSIEGLDLVRA